MTMDPNADEFLAESNVDVPRLLFETLLGAFSVAGANAAGAAENAQQRSRSAWRNSLPPLTESLDAWRRGIITDRQLENVLGRQGFSDTAQAMFRGLARQLLPAADLVTLWQRGELSEAELDERLGALGIAGEDAERLRVLAFAPAGPNDVIRFSVREVYSPELRQSLELDADFPEAATAQFRKAGLSPELARDYWAAHWELPSINLAFTMFHRGLIAEDDLRLILRAQDVMPRFRESIIGAAYQPITRVDIRRIHALGGKDRAWLLRRYRDIGYSPADAEEQADFTEALNSPDRSSRLDSLVEGLRSRAFTALVNGRLSEADVSSVLTALGDEPGEVAAAIAAAEFARVADLVGEQLTQVKGLYTRGQWSEAETLAAVSSLGFSQAEADRQLAPWRLTRESRDLTAEERAQRDLTKTEVLTLYRERITDELDALSGLEALGYDTDESAALLALEDLRAAREEVTALKASLRTRYLEGQLSTEDVRNRLLEIGVEASATEALLIRWSAEREARRPTLTKAELRGALKAGLLQRDDVDRRLEAQGFLPVDRDVLLDLWAGDGEVPE